MIKSQRDISSEGDFWYAFAINIYKHAVGYNFNYVFT